jgi:methylthioribose-1-phosphate isomerase
METVKWNGDSVTILDQRLLPLKEVYNTYRDHHDVAEAIVSMEQEGLPLLV